MPILKLALLLALALHSAAQGAPQESFHYTVRATGSNTVTLSGLSQ